MWHCYSFLSSQPLHLTHAMSKNHISSCENAAAQPVPTIPEDWKYAIFLEYGGPVTPHTVKPLSSSRSNHAEYFKRLRKTFIHHWKWWDLEFDENWSLRLGAGWSQSKDQQIVKFLKNSNSVSLSKYVTDQLQASYHCWNRHLFLCVRVF